MGKRDRYCCYRDSGVPEKTANLYFNIAQIFASQSYCKRLQVGSVCVNLSNEASIIGAYNGTLPGAPNVCETDDGISHSGVIHAEENIICKAAKIGFPLEGCDFFGTHLPCNEKCATKLIRCGIIRIHFLNDYRDMSSIDTFNEHGIDVFRWM